MLGSIWNWLRRRRPAPAPALRRWPVGGGWSLDEDRVIRLIRPDGTAPRCWLLRSPRGRLTLVCPRFRHEERLHWCEVN